MGEPLRIALYTLCCAVGPSLARAREMTARRHFGRCSNTCGGRSRRARSSKSASAAASRHGSSACPSLTESSRSFASSCGDTLTRWRRRFPPRVAGSRCRESPMAASGSTAAATAAALFSSDPSSPTSRTMFQ